jgi:hypothetical protein
VRAGDKRTGKLFSYVDLGMLTWERAGRDHPRRAIPRNCERSDIGPGARVCRALVADRAAIDPAGAPLHDLTRHHSVILSGPSPPPAAS